METLTNNQKEMLEIKNPMIGIKNAFDQLTIRLDMAEECVSYLEGTSVGTSHCKV